MRQLQAALELYRYPEIVLLHKNAASFYRKLPPLAQKPNAPYLAPFRKQMLESALFES